MGGLRGFSANPPGEGWKRFQYSQTAATDPVCSYILCETLLMRCVFTGNVSYGSPSITAVGASSVSVLAHDRTRKRNKRTSMKNSLVGDWEGFVVGMPTNSGLAIAPGLVHQGDKQRLIVTHTSIMDKDGQRDNNALLLTIAYRMVFGVVQQPCEPHQISHLRRTLILTHWD